MDLWSSRNNNGKFHVIFFFRKIKEQKIKENIKNDNKENNKEDILIEPCNKMDPEDKSKKSKIHLQLISSFIGMNLFVCLFVFIMKKNFKKLKKISSIFGNKEILNANLFFINCAMAYRDLSLSK